MADHETTADAARAAQLAQGRNPDLPPTHPVNALSRWRKAAILGTLSYCALLGNFAVAIILVAFVPMGETFGVTPGAIANCIGYSFLGMAVGPLFWNPLSRTAGRRPVYLLGSVLLLPCAVWLALSPSYGSFAAARVVTGFINSFSQTVPPSTIADIYVERVLGAKMALYVVCIVVAPAVAPIFCAGIVKHKSWRVLFWFVLGLYALQLILFFFVVPETMWNEEAADTDSHAEADKPPAEHVDAAAAEKSAPGPIARSGRVGVAWWPWQRPREYLSLLVSPVIMFKYLAILITSFYYGMIFAWSVGITIILPQKYAAPPYSFGLIATGAAFLAFGIGGVIGIPLGGIAGDKAVSYFAAKTGRREPEHRLWALYPILPLFFVSCIVCGCGLQYDLHWIAFLFGGGIMYATLTAITGVLQTYVLETYLPKGMDTQAVFTFWRLMWAFSVAFYVFDWGMKHGWLKEFIIQGGLGLGLGLLLCFGLIWKGKQLREWQGMPGLD
ncbi:hypothetical protein Q8F55_003373 [Vanrija albida]|uniref:Major facilitator superfamily (MFS) profile domain-containing protein n=1 Tax=Vanrija albida TaxID=181172 RepID=A0ABR3Q3S0_9TREE